MKNFYFFIVLSLLTVMANAQSFVRPSVDEEKSPLLGARVPQYITNQNFEKYTTNLTCSLMAQSYAPNVRKLASTSQELPTEMITEQPEGKLYKNYSRHAYGYSYFWGYVIYSETDGYTSDLVVSEDGSVYLYNPLSTVLSGSWLKCEKAIGDTVVAKFPQAIYQQDADTYYAYRMLMNDKRDNYVIDTESQEVKFVWRNDSLIKVDDALIGLTTSTGDWMGYGDDLIEIGAVTDQTAAPTNPNAAKQAYMEYYEHGYTGLGTSCESAFVKYTIEGNNIYIAGLSPNMPDAWAKGDIDGDKVVFHSGTYLGVDTISYAHTYLMPAIIKTSWSDIYEQYEDSVFLADDITFTYDAEKQMFKSDGSMILNSGKKFQNDIEFYAKPFIMAWHEEAGTPKDPVLTDFMEYDASFGYGYMKFTIDNYDTNEYFMNPNKVYYNIYLDDELLTIYPDEYRFVDEEITDLPLKYTDHYAILVSGTEHKLYLYSMGYSTVGIQVTYTGGGEEHKSALMTYNITGIGTIARDNEGHIKSIIYTDLSGRRTTQPIQGGIYVKSITYDDGTVSNFKMINR